MRRPVSALAAALTLTLTACGGSSGNRAVPETTTVPEDTTYAVTDTIAVGDGSADLYSPGSVAVSSDAVWVTNADDATLSRIDLASRAVTDVIAVGEPIEASPPDPFGVVPVFGVAVSSDDVWVTNRADGSLSRNNLVRTITLPLASGTAFGVAASPEAVWVVAGNSVDHLDPNTHAWIDRVGINGANQVAMSADAVWVTANDGTLSRINPDTGDITGTVSIDGDAVGVAATEDAIWVAGGDTLSRVDPATMSVTDSVDGISEGNSGGVTGVAASDDAIWVTVASNTPGTAVRIDAESLEVTDAVDVGGDPLGLAISNDVIWVNNEGDGTVSRIGHEAADEAPASNADQTATTNTVLGSPLSTPDTTGSPAVANPPDEIASLPVYVANGSGVTGAAGALTDTLITAGYSAAIAPEGNAPATPVTLVYYVRDATNDYLADAEAVAALIGVQPTAVQVLPTDPGFDIKNATVVVYLGPDLAPAG